MERILIADDEALMRQLVADFLRPEGYEVLEAVDGKQALDIFNEQKPDLVLLDVMMPGYDGVQRNSPHIDGSYYHDYGER